MSSATALWRGRDAYYIGYASELSEIIQALGEANVGVALLPSGPVAPGGTVAQ